MTSAGSSTVSFTGLSSAMAPSFSFAISSASVWFEHKVAIDDYSHRETRPDCKGRLDVEIAPYDLLTGLAQGIPCPTAKGLQNGVVSVAIRAGPKFGSYTKPSRQQRRPEELTRVMINLVLKPGVACGIGTRLTLKDDRSAVRHDQACPDQEHA
jgi:hypothetical protein